MYEVGADGFASEFCCCCAGVCVFIAGMISFGQTLLLQKIVCFFSENIFLGFFSLPQLNGIVCEKGIVGEVVVSQNHHCGSTCNFSTSWGDVFSPESRISFGILYLLKCGNTCICVSVF